MAPSLTPTNGKFAGHADRFAADAVLISRMGHVRGRVAIMAQKRSYAVQDEVLQRQDGHWWIVWERLHTYLLTSAS